MIAGTYDPNCLGRTVVVTPLVVADTLRDHKGSALDPQKLATHHFADNLHYD